MKVVHVHVYVYALTVYDKGKHTDLTLLFCVLVELSGKECDERGCEAKPPACQQTRYETSALHLFSVLQNNICRHVSSSGLSNIQYTKHKIHQTQQPCNFMVLISHEKFC